MTSLKPLKLGLLTFWALWFSCATTTNLADLLYQYAFLPATWKFVSHNYNIVSGIMSIYSIPQFFVTLTFIIILCIEFIISCTFWWATFQFAHAKSNSTKWIHAAFTLSIFLWASFLVGEEIFIAYAFESTHLGLLVAELICLITICKLNQGQTA